MAPFYDRCTSYPLQERRRKNAEAMRLQLKRTSKGNAVCRCLYTKISFRPFISIRTIPPLQTGALKWGKWGRSNANSLLSHEFHWGLHIFTVFLPEICLFLRSFVDVCILFFKFTPGVNLKTVYVMLRLFLFGTMLDGWEHNLRFISIFNFCNTSF